MKRYLLTLTIAALSLSAAPESVPAGAREIGRVTTVRTFYAVPCNVRNAQCLVIVDTEVRP
jgi:hypothetical protein